MSLGKYGHIVVKKEKIKLILFFDILQFLVMRVTFLQGNIKFFKRL